MGVLRRLVSCGLVAAVLVLGACSADEKPIEYPPVVPGGAPVVVSPGSPPVCAALAASAPIRNLGLALDKMALDDVDGAAGVRAAGVRAAAADARAIAGDAGGDVAEALAAFADALENLAQTGLADADAASRLRSGFEAASEEVQALCHFPVG
jgi:hypothetical protein